MIDERKEYCFATTVVDGTVMEIWRRNEKHTYGQMNGCSDDMWLRYRRGKTEEWLPWIDKLTHRPCWDVKIKQGHYTKHKWGETQINGSVYCAISCNLNQVAEFSCRDFDYAFAKAQVMIAQMSEHTFDFTNPQKEIGRKVYWREQPAKVGDHIMLDQGCIIVKYDGDGPGFDMRTCPWHGATIEDEDFEDDVKVDILDPNIWWFRDA